MFSIQRYRSSEKKNGCPHWLAVPGIKYPVLWLVPIQAQTWIVGSFIFRNSINSADANLCACVRIAASRSSFVSLPFSPMQTMNGTWRSLQTTVKVVWAIYAHLAGIRSSAQLQCNYWRFILASTPFLLLAMAPIEPSWGIVSQNVSDKCRLGITRTSPKKLTPKSDVSSFSSFSRE